MANPEHVERLLFGVESWNVWRSQTTERIDLSGAGFRNAHLQGVNLSDANLQKALFTGAKVSEADFSGALLHHAIFDNVQATGAKFAHARVIDVSFLGANLSRADFSSAALDFANFHLANLEAADFSVAELAFTVFAQSNLSQIKGLEKCLHVRPSSIDFRTLKNSGVLPQKFLRGCGLSDEIIKLTTTQLADSAEFYSAFISHSHEDKVFARRLHDRLQDQGIRCWLDEHQLLPGDDLHDRIDQGIRLWDKVLLCASKSSLTSWWVDGEINRAFQKEAQIMKERGKKVLALIPLNLDGFLFSADYQSGKKSEIKSRVAANFVGWEKDHALFDRELEKVVRALRMDDGGRERPPAPRL